MDFPFFTEDEQPTMENFNKKFRELSDYSMALSVPTGSYAGTGEESRFVNVGFTPSFVIVWNLEGLINSEPSSQALGNTRRYYSGACTKNEPMKGYNAKEPILYIQENGFIVHEKMFYKLGSDGTVAARDTVNMNSAPKRYAYVAFR